MVVPDDLLQPKSVHSGGTNLRVLYTLFKLLKR